MLKKLRIPLLSLSLLTALPVLANAEEGTSSTEFSVRAVPQKDASINTEQSMSNSDVSILTISDPSGWQSRGQYSNTVYVGNTPRQAIPYQSGVNWRSAGGNFKVEFTGILSGNSFTAQLMEYDADNADDPVGQPIRIDAFNNTLLAENISGFVDDTEAEFYVHVYNAFTQDFIYAEGFD
ncbi:hypothetical protein IHV10_20105 [Fictibacillus sp. 5RED26]|jgi:hypothetical protein|uniref:hypothetical protein n=1 Tax=Fictibacillus sp. 5RED26 TaxID=2745876 RepID=UPI0018CDDA0A|nr:hypothetical protein [Fictibacillus sp. 5RED26]MBH0158690.1 hypothetical protein [Fictibacillus sp. 5RED26]